MRFNDFFDERLASDARAIKRWAHWMVKGLARRAAEARDQLEAARLAQDLSRLTRLGSNYYGSPWDIKNARKALADPSYDYSYKKGSAPEAQRLIEKSGGLKAALMARAERSSPRALAIAMGPSAVWSFFEKSDALSYDRRPGPRLVDAVDLFFKREILCSPLALAYYAGSLEAAELFESWGANDSVALLWGAALGSGDLASRAKKLGLKTPKRMRALMLAYASGNQEVVDFALERSLPLDERQSALCWGLCAGEPMERARLEALSLAYVVAPAERKRRSARSKKEAARAASGLNDFNRDQSSEGSAAASSVSERRAPRKGAL